MSGSAIADSATLPFHAANELLHAVGKLTVSSEKLLSTLQICGARFTHLNESATDTRSQWLNRNRTVLGQSAMIRDYVMNAVKHDASAFTAEKMLLDTDALISKEIEQFRQDFEHKGRKEQHYLCNRLILSIPGGELDLASQLPDETRMVLEFKP